MRRPVRHAPKSVTKAHNRVALLSVITMRDDLDSANVESLARSYGVPEADVRIAIAQEKRRRG